jgi:nitrogen fixation protein FixH
LNVWMKVVIGLAVATVVALIGATVLVGSKVREETVVARPYEEGLHHDAERAARAALGLAVAVEDEAPVAGAAPLAFRLSDREGRPLEGATVEVEASRPDTSRGEVRAAARAVGPGRYAADLALPSPGAWDVRFDVQRGTDRVRLERRLVAAAPCDAGAGPCTRVLPGGDEVTLELGPRPLRTMAELSVAVSLGRGGAPVEPDSVSVSFAMPGMEMGENRVRLTRRGAGRFEGKAVLVRCASGRRDWVAAVTVGRAGADAGLIRFPLRAEE